MKKKKKKKMMPNWVLSILKWSSKPDCKTMQADHNRFELCWMCKECWYQFNITIKNVQFIFRFSVQLLLMRLLHSVCCFHFLLLLLLYLSTTQLATFTNIFVCTLIAFLSIPFVRFISQYLTSPTSASCTFFWSFCYMLDSFFVVVWYLFFHLAEMINVRPKWIFGIFNEKVYKQTHAAFGFRK